MSDAAFRLAGKRDRATRPDGAIRRSRIGHWEVDTVLGASHVGACIGTLAERTTGDVVIGKLARHTEVTLNSRLKGFVRRQTRTVRTISVDMRAGSLAVQAYDRRVTALGRPMMSRWGRWEWVGRMWRTLENDVAAEITDGWWMTGGEVGSHAARGACSSRAAACRIAGHLMTVILHRTRMLAELLPVSDTVANASDTALG